MTIMAVRPRLRGDVHFVPLDEGVFVRSSTSTMTLHGRSAYAWLERLLPYLDGRATVAQLTEGLTEDRRAVVHSLLSRLHEHGFFRDLAVTGPHTLTEAEQRTYLAEIEFVAQFADSAEHRFQRYRETVVVAVGSGRTLVAWLHMALRSGLRDLRLAITDECPTDTDRIAEYQALARDRDPEQEVSVQSVGADETALRSALAAAEFIVHISDRLTPDRARLLDRLAAETGRPLVQAVLVGDEAWIGPVRDAEGQTPGWDSIQRRLAGAGHRASPAAQPSEYLTGPTVSLVANHVAFRCFRNLTGTERPGPVPTVCHLDLETLRQVDRPLLPHQLAVAARPESEAEFAGRIARLRELEPLTEDQFSERIMTAFDDRIGVFGAVDEGHLEQLPLRVARVTVATGGPPEEAFGTGRTFAQARFAATRSALERYCAATLDHRRQPAPGRIWGLDLATGAPRLVDAVFRRAAAGYSWAEAVELGLCRLGADLAATWAPTEPLARVSLARLDLDEEGARLARILDTAGEPVAVYAIPAPIPAFAVCVGGETVAYTCAPDPRQAIGAGLHQAVLAYQARTASQPDYAPAPVPALPAHLRGLTEAELPAPIEPDRLADALITAGHRPVVVPLDHDPAIAAIAPHVLGVVLGD